MSPPYRLISQNQSGSLPERAIAMLVFWAGGRYGVIDPIEIDVHQRLRVNWWLGEPGVVDFSVAGSDQQ